jgi:hypothetical protein
MGEGGRADPALEGRVIPPTGDDQPLAPLVGGPEELEAFEPLLVVDRPSASGEPLGQLVSGTLGHRDGVDLDNCASFFTHGTSPRLIRRERFTSVSGLTVTDCAQSIALAAGVVPLWWT